MAEQTAQERLRLGEVIGRVLEERRANYADFGDVSDRTCRALGMWVADMFEVIGYLPDGQNPDADWHSFARQDMEVGEPIYRVGGGADAAE